MDELEMIRKRIAEPKKEKSHKRHPLYRLMMIILILTSFLLGFLIYARVDENGTFLNKIFHTNINFSSFNEKVNNIFDRMFNFNVFKNQGGDQTVNGNVMYLKTSDKDHYTCEDNNVRMLKRGVISYVDEVENSTFIMVTYENGVIASYFDLFDPLVKAADQLKCGDIIANYENSFKVIFQKEGSVISYEEAFM